MAPPIALSIAAVWIAVFALACSASQEAVYQVAQPIVTRDGAVAVSFVTYVGLQDDDNPGLQVAYTCRANALTAIVRSSDGFEIRPWSPTNLNVANLAGFKVSLLWNDRAENAYPVYGDTLRVELMIPTSFDASDLPAPVSLTSVVHATKEAMLLNAAVHWPRIKFLDIRVLCSDQYPDVSGTHSLEGLPRLDRRYVE